MLCQSCYKNQANTHIKKIINGKLTEYRLCEECAAKLGYGNIFSGFDLNFDNFLGSFFKNQLNDKQSVLENDVSCCPKCGSTLEDISRTGKIGCSKCYDVFYNSLIGSIKRIHGNTVHTGKMAECVSEDKKLKVKMEKLKKDMQIAIKEQNFERAAQIRDEVKKLESEGDNNE